MKFELHIDRLVVHGFEEAQVRAALDRLPRHLQGLAAKVVAGGRLPDLKIKAASADPDVLARNIVRALNEAPAAQAAHAAAAGADHRRRPWAGGPFQLQTEEHHE